MYNYKWIVDSLGSLGINCRPDGFMLYVLKSELSRCLGNNVWIEDDCPTFNWPQVHYTVMRQESEQEESESKPHHYAIKAKILNIIQFQMRKVEKHLMTKIGWARYRGATHHL